MINKLTFTVKTSSIQRLLLLWFVYLEVVVVVYGILVKENGFCSIPQVADRGDFLKLLSREAGRQVFCFGLSLKTVQPPQSFNKQSAEYAVHHPFRYSSDWTGTNLQTMDVTTAVLHAIPMEKPPNGSVVNFRWPMGRWPDPILRRIADPVEASLFGSDILRQACDILRNTALAEGAVGLAAQQCGVNARIIYLEIPSFYENSYVMLINPRITRRSPEVDVRVWRENCLVLPPSFQATVLRDSWVDVKYQDWKGNFPFSVKRLYGEVARALQHEMDHDRGILVTDHVSLDELENDQMRLIERPDHDSRMALAYDRFMY